MGGHDSTTELVLRIEVEKQQISHRATPYEERKCECDVLLHHCKALIKRHILPQNNNKKNVTQEAMSKSQNINSHVTVKQYMEEDVHSYSDTEMQHVVGAPKKKMAKTKNNNVVQDGNKEKMMVSKVFKDSSKAVQQQHIYVKRDNAHCISS